MNPSVLAALAASLLAALWLLSRRRQPPLLADTATDAVVALNRAQIALVRGEGAAASGPGSLGRFEPADTVAQDLRAQVPPALLPQRLRREWFLRLRAGFRAGGAERRAAITTARLWGHPDVLPLLREALRDPDPVVMREAALAMEAFRRRPAPPTPSPRRPQRTPRPRSVARMR